MRFGSTMKCLFQFYSQICDFSGGGESIHLTLIQNVKGLFFTFLCRLAKKMYVSYCFKKSYGFIGIQYSFASSWFCPKSLFQHKYYLLYFSQNTENTFFCTILKRWAPMLTVLPTMCSICHFHSHWVHRITCFHQKQHTRRSKLKWIRKNPKKMIMVHINYY